MGGTTEIETEKLELQPFVKRSVTTLAGNAPGTTLVDATLVEAANFWNGCWLLLRTGTYAGQLRRVVAFASPTITLDHTVGGQIVAGVQYVMLPKLAVDIIAGGGLKADLRQVLGQGADLSLANPLVAQIVVAGAAIDPRDVSNRAARLLGIVYGNLAQLQQVPGTLELITQDTGLNTNPERWLHDYHWEANQVTVAVAGAPGQQNLGAVVGAGVTRRIRVLSIRHAGTNNTVVTILIAGGATKVSIDVPATTTRVWSSQDGIEFTAGQQPAVQTSDITGGSTYVTPEGVED